MTLLGTVRQMHSPAPQRAQASGLQPVLQGRTVTGPLSARIEIDGRPYLNFYGTGYLALSRVPEIRQAVADALAAGHAFAQHLPAAFGARDPVFDPLEQEAARALGEAASLHVASGYLIGGLAMALIEERFDIVLLDAHAHYNLVDAALVSRRPVHRFAHADAGALEQALKQHVGPGRRPLVVTDGVFATSGEIAPLADYAALLAPYDGQLLVDDSHGFGVVGQHGRGAAELCGVEGRCLRGATLSKAYCAQGAILGCSHEAARRARDLPQLRGATIGSPLSAAAARASLAYMGRHPERRTALNETTACLRAALRQIGLEVPESPAPIVSFTCGTRANALALQRRAFARGIFLYVSNYVGAGEGGLIRCAVFADHARSDIDALIAAIR